MLNRQVFTAIFRYCVGLASGIEHGFLWTHVSLLAQVFNRVGLRPMSIKTTDQ
jgi:hypothetical protein